MGYSVKKFKVSTTGNEITGVPPGALPCSFTDSNGNSYVSSQASGGWSSEQMMWRYNGGMWSKVWSDTDYASWSWRAASVCERANGDLMMSRIGENILTSTLIQDMVQKQDLSGGEYFFFYGPTEDGGAEETHYAWYNVSGADADPAPGGTGHEVDISGLAATTYVGFFTGYTINALDDFIAESPISSAIYVASAHYGNYKHAEDGNCGFSYSVSLYGAAGGDFYTSADSGVTWTLHSENLTFFPISVFELNGNLMCIAQATVPDTGTDTDGTVKIFEWDSVNSEWDQVGATLTGSATNVVKVAANEAYFVVAEVFSSPTSTRTYKLIDTGYTEQNEVTGETLGVCYNGFSYHQNNMLFCINGTLGAERTLIAAFFVSEGVFTTAIFLSRDTGESWQYYDLGASTNYIYGSQPATENGPFYFLTKTDADSFYRIWTSFKGMKNIIEFQRISTGSLNNILAMVNDGKDTRIVQHSSNYDYTLQDDTDSLLPRSNFVIELNEVDSGVFYIKRDDYSDSGYYLGRGVSVLDGSDNLVWFGIIESINDEKPIIELTLFGLNQDWKYPVSISSTSSDSDAKLQSALDTVPYSWYDTNIADGAFDYSMALNKNIETLINEFKFVEDWVIYNHPDGEIIAKDKDSPTDCALDWTEDTSGVRFLRREVVDKRFTRVLVKGYGVEYEKIDDSYETRRGIVKFPDIINRSITDSTYCQYYAENLLTVFKTPTTFYTLLVTGSTLNTATLQVGHSIGINWDDDKNIITSDDYIIERKNVFPVSNTCYLTVTDGFISSQDFNVKIEQRRFRLFEQRELDVINSVVVHTNVASEISGMTAKATPTTSDIIMIEDVADSNNKKKITLDDLPVVSDLAAHEALSIHDQGVAYKSSDEAISSDNTYSSDADLNFVVENGEKYIFEAILFYYHDPGPDFKAKPYMSTNATELNAIAFRHDTINDNIGGNVIIDAVDWSEGFELSSGIAAGIMVCEIKGSFEAGANGTFYIQWAQRASSGTNTTLYKGSYLKYQKIG